MSCKMRVKVITTSVLKSLEDQFNEELEQMYKNREQLKWKPEKIEVGLTVGFVLYIVKDC